MIRPDCLLNNGGCSASITSILKRKISKKYAVSLNMNFIGPSTSVAFIGRKGLIERIVQYLKDKRELMVPMITNYSCIIEVCELEYVYRWIALFIAIYNALLAHIEFRLLCHVI